MMKRLWLIGLLVSAAAVPGWAETITENPVASDVLPSFAGQSLTTPAGGPWNNITFNWFSDFPATTPNAFGTAFLLTQDYSGLPAGLSAATPGFLAQSQSIAGGKYFFAPGLTLSPSTQYWLYTNQSGLISGGLGSPYPGGIPYFSFASGEDFEGAPAQEIAFRLEGDLAPAVPEPSSFAMAALGLLSLGFYGWRRRKCD